METTPGDAPPSPDATIPTEYYLPQLNFAKTRPTTATSEARRYNVSKRPQDDYIPAPDYVVWRTYAEESKIHDKELVERRNKNLDTMLLFAGLFSAILTAFLIEATRMMEPNLTRTTTLLLLHLTQSPWRAETGNQTDSPPLSDIPVFKPSNQVRWINALWFMALTLSLGAAMLAMLAKEWLAEFIASAPADPLQNARKQQNRLETLTSWNTLQIIDFLPTLLHFSLVLFTLGLVIRLWLLDHIIALLIGSTSATLFLCYLLMVMLGAVCQESPFQTRVSKHLSALFWFPRRLFSCGYWRKEESENVDKPLQPDKVTAEHLRALLWLIRRVTDRTIISGAFQELIDLVTHGLKLYTGDKTPIQANILLRPWDPVWAWFRKVVTTSEDTLSTSLAAFDGYNTVVSVGQEIADHIVETPRSYKRELAFFNGENIASYASVFPGIYSYVCEYSSQAHDPSREGGRTEQERPGRAKEVRRLEESFFKALDIVWDGDFPPFSANAYAELTAAELSLTGFAIENSNNNLNPQRPTGSYFINIPVAQAPWIPNRGEGESSNRYPATNLEPNHGPPPDDPNLIVTNIRARCSRALCRATVQLTFHLNGRAPIGNSALTNLLKAISVVAEKDTHDSGQHIITHYPQSYNDPDPAAIFVPIFGDDDEHALKPDEIGHCDGLLATLTKVLAWSSTEADPKLEDAAIVAMSSIAPKLIDQWIAINSSGTLYEYLILIHQQMSTRSHRTIDIVNHLLNVANFAIRFTGSKGVCQLPEIALEALYSKLSAGSSVEAHDELLDRIVGQFALLKEWIQALGSAGTRYQRKGTASPDNWWSQQAKTYLMLLLTIENEQGETLFSRVLSRIEEGSGDLSHTKEAFLIVLDTMLGVPDGATILAGLFSTISSRIRERGYSACFAKTSGGFDCLESVHSPSYACETIMELITKFGQVGEKRERIESDAVPGFMRAVGFLCKYCSSFEERFRGCLQPIATIVKELLADPTNLPGDVLFALSDSEPLADLVEFSKSIGQPAMKSFQESIVKVSNEIGRRRILEAATEAGDIHVKLPQGQNMEAERVGNCEVGDVAQLLKPYRASDC